MTKKKKWEEKQLLGHFKRLMNSILHEKNWTWLSTNYIKTRLDKTQQNSKYRLCGDRNETINHIIRECSKLAQKETRMGGKGDRLGDVQEI